MAETTFSWTKLSGVASVTDQEMSLKLAIKLKSKDLCTSLPAHSCLLWTWLAVQKQEMTQTPTVAQELAPLDFCWVTERVVSGVLGFEPGLSSSMIWSFSHLHQDSVHPKHPYSTCSTANKSHAVMSFVFLLFNFGTQNCYWFIKDTFDILWSILSIRWQPTNPKLVHFKKYNNI